MRRAGGNSAFMKPRPTAIFAANDESAISVLTRLTTMDIPKKRMAAYALQMLMLHKQFQTQEAASIVLPTELIIRESCGFKRAKK